MLNYRKHNLWRAFVNFPFDGDEVPPSQKHTHIKARVLKPYPICDQIGQNQLKSIPYLWPKRQKSIPFGAAHTYITHIKEYPPPPFPGANYKKEDEIVLDDDVYYCLLAESLDGDTRSLNLFIYLFIIYLTLFIHG